MGVDAQRCQIGRGDARGGEGAFRDRKQFVVGVDHGLNFFGGVLACGGQLTEESVEGNDVAVVCTAHTRQGVFLHTRRCATAVVTGQQRQG